MEGDVTEEERLEGIKLCIDTSGSMSDIDIGIAVGQIMQLCAKYSVQADIVYWDDGIQDIIPYEEINNSDLKHYQAMGRGGTNPNCIFEEFSKREYTIGKKVKPSLIIIFTDGYWSGPDIKYKGKFGRDTIWVLCSQNSVPFEQFEPPFGKVALFKK
jgi:predicted metal-dependent peptidase